MQEYIQKRVLEITNYILESTATVRQAASVFGVSKSTVHTVLRIGVGCIGCLSTQQDR
jgi:predicted XRE-type DNA-binding protein